MGGGALRVFGERVDRVLRRRRIPHHKQEQLLMRVRREAHLSQLVALRCSTVVGVGCLGRATLQPI
jgi:hypothetical protein